MLALVSNTCDSQTAINGIKTISNQACQELPSRQVVGCIPNRQVGEEGIDDGGAEREVRCDEVFILK